MKFLGSLAMASMASAAFTSDYEWHAWKNQHQISFTSAREEATRYNIFVESRNFVKTHNERAAEGLETYTVGLNKFAAMSIEEFEEKYLNTKMADPVAKLVLEWDCDSVKYTNSGNNNPSDFSWANGRQGYAGETRVTNVKDQGSCGSCWSFATSAVLEATVCQNGQQDCDTWNGLAPQQLVDCLSYTKGESTDLNPYDDHGCSGGFITNGVRSIDLYGGQMNWDDYPYVSGQTKTEGTCVYDASKANLNLSSGCARLPSADEDTMVDAIANVGPLGIGINASGRGFSLYTGGVYSNPSCTDRLNHAVTATGYGTWAATGQDYFEIKNSWGATWGDAGFINIARNDGNMCGVSSDAMYNLA